MEGRTQLIIDGVVVVLPQGFATTVKRENSFFTKNGEYTYDCTLRLDNQTNRELYGFLQRLNKKEAVASKRSAVLMANGRVYCRGTEVITGWTDEEVTVQVVSGNSELNYFIGNDLKIEWLDLGEIQGDVAACSGWRGGSGDRFVNSFYPDVDYCLPTIFNASEGVWYNNYLARGMNGFSLPRLIVGNEKNYYVEAGGNYFEVVAQPFLCALVRRLINSLGYTIGINQLEETQFKDLFVVNTRPTKKFAKMLPGWTVKDFLEEVEKLTGVVFLTSNTNKTVDILQKSVYYAHSRIISLQNVSDSYELSIDESSDAEWSNANVGYDLPDESSYRLLKLPDGLKGDTVVETDEFPFTWWYTMKNSVRKFLKDISTLRTFIRSKEIEESSFITVPGKLSVWDELTDLDVVCPPVEMYKWEELMPETSYDAKTQIRLWGDVFGRVESTPKSITYGHNPYLTEVDQFSDLKRDHPAGEIQLKLMPALMKLMPSYCYETHYDLPANKYILRQGFSNIVWLSGAKSGATTISPNDSEVSMESVPFSDAIANYAAPEESSAENLFCAFYAGFQQHRHCYLPQAYTDAWHAQNLEEFWHEKEDSFPSIATEAFTGSLRLKDIEAELYAGVYRIDTTQKVVFETYDPNMLDPRAIIVVRNRRWVVREIEETLTSSGRKPSWKVTCHPIEISDTAAENRWVLTRGVWDDGGAWLDGGRWND